MGSGSQGIGFHSKCFLSVSTRLKPLHALECSCHQCKQIGPGRKKRFGRGRLASETVRDLGTALDCPFMQLKQLQVRCRSSLRGSGSSQLAGTTGDTGLTMSLEQ